MAFSWKNRKDIFKGEGVYFLTFVVNNRVPLLGMLRALDVIGADGHRAVVDLSPLGSAVCREFNALQYRYKGLQVLAKQVMPDHFHGVVWCHEEFEGSIKMVARGFAQGCSRVAREMNGCARLNRAGNDDKQHTDDGCYADGHDALHLGMNAGHGDALSSLGASAGHDLGMDAGRGGALPSLGANAGHEVCRGDALSSLGANAGRDLGMDAGHCDALSSLGAEYNSSTLSSYDCGNGANTLFATPFIRTLVHAGQLRAMIDYTHNNPDNALLRHLNPDLYVIRRRVEIAGMHFDTMGKSRLLDYPDREVVALSRSLTKEQIDMEVTRVLRLAESGTVVYTAAINDGEKAVAKAVREGGFPLVVMMLDGFPPEGSDAARYFHPSGVYHTACGEGRLLLLSPLAVNYSSPELVSLTDTELKLKAETKGYSYRDIPRESKRWRMIAGNVMLRMIAG